MKLFLYFTRLLLVMIVCALVLSSCNPQGCGDGTGEVGGSEGEGSGGSDDIPEVEQGQTLYYSSSEIVILAADSSGRDAAEGLIGSLYENVLGEGGRAFIGSEYIADQFSDKIIVGYFPAIEASRKAYELLYGIESNSVYSESRYLIYADNGTIAIAYDNEESIELKSVTFIIDRFITDNIIGKSRVFFECGVVTKGKINLIEEQQKIDDLTTEKRWETVESKIKNEQIYLALREYFEKMFNRGVLEWVGSLYDPMSGLFYASVSGKNAEGVHPVGVGYYPHPEATSISLSFLEHCGALAGFNGDFTRVLPEKTIYKITYYLKSIQDSSGEFYVAQMPKSTIAPERVGRDRSSAIGLFTMIGTSPRYSVANLEGDGIDGETYWASLVASGKVTEDEKPIIYWAVENIPERTASVQRSVPVAVSRAVMSSSVSPASDISSIFESHDSFLNHLLTKDPYNDPYGAISNISSISSLAHELSPKMGAYDPDGDPDGVGRGVSVTVGNEMKTLVILNKDTLNDIIVKWMNLYINEAGLFGKATYATDNGGNPIYDGFFGGWGFNNCNGFMKGISRYLNARIPYPEPRKAAESLLRAINSPESAAANGNVLVMYNVWVSLCSLRTSIETHYTGDDKQDLLDYIAVSMAEKVDLVTGESIDKPYAALAIERAYEQVRPFMKADGAYGHSPSVGTSGWQGGLPVGVGEDNLGDIDATFCTMTGMSSYICQMFGIDMKKDVPMYTTADLYRFLEAMDAQPNVVKKTPAERAEEGSSSDPVEKVSKFDSLPAFLTVMNTAGYSITEKDGDNVLLVDKEAGGVRLQYFGVNEEAEDATVTEFGFDLLIENSNLDGSFELYLCKGNAEVFLPCFIYSGTKLFAYDHGSGISPVFSGIEVGKWVSILVRYYNPDGEGYYELFVDGEKIMSGSRLREGVSYPEVSEMTGMRITMSSASTGKFYYDNMFIRQIKD